MSQKYIWPLRKLEKLRQESHERGESKDLNGQTIKNSLYSCLTLILFDEENKYDYFLGLSVLWPKKRHVKKVFDKTITLTSN